jgi:hypothetical protein
MEEDRKGAVNGDKCRDNNDDSDREMGGIDVASRQLTIIYVVPCHAVLLSCICRQDNRVKMTYLLDARQSILCMLMVDRQVLLMRGAAHGFCCIMLHRGRCHGYVIDLHVRYSEQHGLPLRLDHPPLPLHSCVLSCDACNTNPNPRDRSLEASVCPITVLSLVC